MKGGGTLAGAMAEAAPASFLTGAATGITADGGIDDGRAVPFVVAAPLDFVGLATFAVLMRFVGGAAFTGLAFAERGDAERD
jgi:hypothetical protein